MSSRPQARRDPIVEMSATSILDAGCTRREAYGLAGWPSQSTSPPRGQSPTLAPQHLAVPSSSTEPPSPDLDEISNADATTPAHRSPSLLSHQAPAFMHWQSKTSVDIHSKCACWRARARRRIQTRILAAGYLPSATARLLRVIRLQRIELRLPPRDSLLDDPQRAKQLRDCHRQLDALEHGHDPFDRNAVALHDADRTLFQTQCAERIVNSSILIDQCSLLVVETRLR